MFIIKVNFIFMEGLKYRLFSVADIILYVIKTIFG